MALSITIGGVDRTSNCRFESLSVLNTIASNADTADLMVSVLTSAGWRPKAGNDITILNGATKEFGGIVTEVVETAPTLSRLSYKLTCRDYLHLLNRRLVVQDYSAQAASAIVTDVVANFSSGFTTTNVQASPSVAAVTYDYVSVGDVIRGLADQLGWGWYVDYNKDIHFYSLVTAAAPVASIDIDSNVTDYGNLILTETVAQERNRVYIKGFKQKSTGTYNRSYTGDGSTKFFLLGYEPSAITDVTLTRNGISQTVGTDMVDSQPDNPTGGANNAYICFSNMGMRYDVAPALNDPISATFNYMFDGLIQVEDTLAQAEMASREGGDGIHEFAISDPGLTANDGSQTLAQTKGESILARDAYPRLTGHFTSFTQGWRAGQSFTLTTTKRMGGFSKTVYVQEVRKRLVNHPGTAGTPLLTYEVMIADSALAI